MNLKLFANNGLSNLEFRGEKCTDRAGVHGRICLRATDQLEVEIFDIGFGHIDFNTEFLRELRTGILQWIDSKYTLGFSVHTTCERHTTHVLLDFDPCEPLTGKGQMSIRLRSWSAVCEYKMLTDQSCLSALVLQIEEILSAIESSTVTQS